MTAKTLEQRIQRLEDIEALKNLTARYATYVNKGWNGQALNPRGLHQVFAADARWDCAAMNARAVGREAVVQLLEQSTARIDFAMHSFTNPIIEVEGDHATGQWLLWVAVKTGTVANEVFQSEDLRYVRTPEGWRIQSIDLHFGSTLTA
jgi:hypothetical protein